jgi:hypothetical protein
MGAEGWELVTFVALPIGSVTIDEATGRYRDTSFTYAVYKRPSLHRPQVQDTAPGMSVGADTLWLFWKLLADAQTGAVPRRVENCREWRADINRDRGQRWTQVKRDTLAAIIAKNCADIR